MEIHVGKSGNRITVGGNYILGKARQASLEKTVHGPAAANKCQQLWVCLTQALLKPLAVQTLKLPYRTGPLSLIKSFC